MLLVLSLYTAMCRARTALLPGWWCSKLFLDCPGYAWCGVGLQWRHAPPCMLKICWVLFRWCVCNGHTKFGSTWALGWRCFVLTRLMMPTSMRYLQFSFARWPHGHWTQTWIKPCLWETPGGHILNIVLKCSVKFCIGLLRTCFSAVSCWGGAHPICHYYIGVHDLASKGFNDVTFLDEDIVREVHWWHAVEHFSHLVHIVHGPDHCQVLWFLHWAWVHEACQVILGWLASRRVQWEWKHTCLANTKHIDWELSSQVFPLMLSLSLSILSPSCSQCAGLWLWISLHRPSCHGTPTCSRTFVLEYFKINTLTALAFDLEFNRHCDM